MNKKFSFSIYTCLIILPITVIGLLLVYGDFCGQHSKNIGNQKQNSWLVKLPVYIPVKIDKNPDLNPSN